MDKLRCWLARKALGFTVQIDYSLKKGDQVVSDGWTVSDLTIVDVNWGLLAVAVKLGDGGVVVWPAWRVRKISV